MLRLHDTAEGRVVDIIPRDAGKLSMYVCGVTVYDVPHIGHARMALVFDVLRRYLEWSGLKVTFVQNITDIEDKIIARSNERGIPFEELTSTYEKAWYNATDRLGIKRPDADPHATAYVDKMVGFIADLIGRGHAYESSDGVYFSIETLPGYGLLARQSLESLRAGASERVEAEDKRAPLDFALWKKAKPGEPTWPSPWGDGRPGWHIECTVMSLDLLGDGFDLHGGGQDLAFPHHENERAQALGAGRLFAHHWVHNGWVEVEGTKMSKSLGNFTNIADLLDRADARAYRLLVLQSHYRSPIEVTGDTIARAERSLAGLDAFARRTADLPEADADVTVLERFTEVMDNDLQTPEATALLFDTVTQANAALDRGDSERAGALAAAAREISAAMGLELRAGGGEEIDSETADLMRQRDEARAGKDFTAADRIRDELVGRGWVVEDTPGGTKVRRA
ncbi:MAG: cysteine--tRNA ligase [Acidimicrobiia bacterium]|nr:cysteine--tRNA ligase [Acidimicrobiia bacterium]